MNRQMDFDQLLDSWLDDGADVAPERFVWAAIADAELTPQRGAWRVRLEGLTMRLQPAAPILGIAAIAIAVIALYAAFLAPNVGSPTPTPRSVAPDELSLLVLNDESAPAGFSVDNTVRGAPALVAGLPPGGPAMDQTGFLDARQTELSGASGGALATWGAVFETASDATAAFRYIAGRHVAADGWGMQPISGAPALGDDRAAYRGAAYGVDDATVYLWQVNNTVLAVIGIGETDPAVLREVAQGMDERAH